MKERLLIIQSISRCVTLIASVLIYLNANAQIIYTDIVPDFSSENLYDSYNLDLNNDLTVDYIISSYYNYFDPISLQITSPNGLNAIISVTPWAPNPMPLNNGVVINHTPTTTNGETYESLGYFIVGDCPSYDPDCFYDWDNSRDKYLGLRFLINGSSHYGWARMDITSLTEWIIKDYAYNATPNAPIVAGQMVLGLEEVDFNKVKVKVANHTITLFNLPNRTEYKLYTINGQVIGHGELLQTSDTIDVQNLTSGLYILELRDKNSQSTLKRKILIP